MESHGPSRVRKSSTEGALNSKRVKALAERRGHLSISTCVYIYSLSLSLFFNVYSLVLSTGRTLMQDILIDMSKLVQG